MIPAWSTQQNSNDINATSGFKGSVSVTGGDTITLNGSLNNIPLGTKSKGTVVKLEDYLTDKSIFDKTVLNYGTLKTIEIPDPVSGTRVVTVYDSSGFNVSAAAKATDTFTIPSNIDDANGRGLYVNMAFGAVYSDQGGGTLNVNLDDADRYMIAKQEPGLFRAYGSSEASASAAVINWNSKINVTYDIAPTYSAGQQVQNGIGYTTFIGTPISVDGKTYAVTDVASMRAYNDALIASMQAGGEITIDNYSAYLQKVYKTDQYYYNYTNTVTAGDSATLSQGAPNLVYATGKSAVVNIAAGSRISVYMPANIGGSAIRLDNGATVNNYGMIAGTLISNVNASNGSVVNNATSGVIIAGTQPTDQQNAGGNGGFGVTLNSQSTFTNSGIVNVFGRPYDSREIGQIWSSGVNVYGSTFVNDTTGVINLGATTVGWWSTPVAAVLQGYATATNKGSILIGYSAQYDLSTPSVEISNGRGRGAQTIGINIYNQNNVFTNNGTISIGRYMENAYGIRLEAGSHQVANASDGTINVNGGYDDSNASYNPLANYGIYINNNGAQSATSFVSNAGTINVGGVNSTAIYAQATNGNSANAQSSGTIDISGSSTYNGSQLLNRNYGMRIVGTGAIGTLSGDLIVGGNGSVGGYSRNGGVIKVEDTADITLQNGKDQIGFVVWGNGSLLESKLSSMKVGTENSIGFYVASGASLVDNNSDGKSLTFDISGKGAIAILASNSGEKSVDSSTGWVVTTGTNITVNSGSTYNLTGEGAQAIRIEGGATGTLSDNSTIVFSANNTIAATVDGQNYSLFREKINDPDSATKLTSSAHITDAGSLATGVIGFAVSNSATLDLTANSNIEMAGADNIGVYVNQATMINAGSISVKGVGVKVEGANSKITNTGTINTAGGLAAIQLLDEAALTLTGSGTIQADGGAHGVYLDTGASSLTMDGSVITVKGTGNGVENKAEITGLTLANGAKINVENGAGIRTSSSLGSANNGTINVSGSGTGVAFQTATGQAISNDIDILDSLQMTVNVTGANGTGLSVLHTGNGVVKSGVSVNVSAQGGSAVVLSGVKSFTNAGELISQSTTNPVISLGTATEVINESTGLISSATGTALTFDNQDSALTNSGTIVGLVNMANGDNTVLLNDGSVSGEIIAGNGTNAFTVKGDATFEKLDGGVGGGNDTLTFDGATYTASADSVIQHFETLKLTNSSSFTTADLIDMTDVSGGVGSVDIDATSTLNLRPTAGYTFNHKLSGSGVVSAIMGTANDAFNFGADTGSLFTGTLKAGRGTFSLAGNNTSALTNATLQVDAGNVTTVGKGNQTIGGLAFNGGTAVFDMTFGAKVANTTITVKHLDANGTGSVKLTGDSSFVNTIPVTDPTTVGLLEQDDENQFLRLVYADTVNYGAGALKLLDKDGNVISDGKQADITQNGVKVAQGSYDYRLSTDDTGMYVSYGLTEIDLIGKDANALVLSARAGATGHATDLSAKLTGSGDLVVSARTGETISLSNTLNDYTGVTTANSGTLAFRADNVLGKTSRLDIKTSATVDMNGYSQSIGSLYTASGGQMIISDGSVLTIDDTLRASSDSIGGNLDTNTLAGSGSFVIDPSIVYVNGVQSNFTGTVQVTGGSQLYLNNASAFNNAQSIELTGANDRLILADLAFHNSTWTSTKTSEMATSIKGVGTVAVRDAFDVTLTGNSSTFTGLFDIAAGSKLTAQNQNNIGSANITANGTFVANTSGQWNFDNTVTGSGQFEKTGGGTMVVKQALSGFTGLTKVSSGMLVLGSADMSSSQIGGALSVDNGAIFAGLGKVTGTVTNNGTIAAFNAVSDYSTSAASTLDLGSLSNNGTIRLAGGAVGNILNVRGDYNSNGGSLILNTVLAADNSATDRLYISGNVSGTTSVQVINRGGLGAKTTGDGIQIIKADGSASGNAFALNSDYSFNGRSAVIGGAYAYSLYAGNASGTFNGDWYLRSLYTGSGGDGDGGTTDPDKVVYSATAPLYEAYPQILQQLNKLGTLQQRVGNRTWLGSGSDNQTAMINEMEGRGFWMKVEGSTGHVNSDISKTRSNFDLDMVKTQLGLDFEITESDAGKLIGGAYVQYGHAKADVSSRYGKGDIKTDGYGLGGTLTWYGANDVYVDGVAQVMWYDTDIKSDWLNKGLGETVVSGNNGTGYAVSVETGKKIALNHEWTMTPQAQLSYNAVDFDSFRDSYGGNVHRKDGDALTGRIGVAFDREKAWRSAAGDMRRLTTYGIGNLYYEFLDGTEISVTSVDFRNRSDRFWGGLGTGVSYNWKDDTYSIYGEVDARSSFEDFGNSYSLNGTVGFKAKF